MNFLVSAFIFSLLAFTKIYLFFAFIYYKKHGKIPLYLLNMSYSSIYYYSKLQLGFMKTQNTITLYVKSVPFLNNLLTYVKPSTNVDIYTYTNVNDNLTICNKYDREKNINFKIILHYTPNYEKKNYIESLQFQQSDYKFIMTEITIDDKKFVVHFTTDNYNYLIEYNKLDKNFINYFLKAHYTDLVKDFEIENYSIKIIDDNVNIIEFDNTKSLLINKSGYEIL